MKPTNLSGKACDPISSDCVIWQGPDIECLHLCKGDKVTDVINKLGIELCNILETLGITTYDFSCLNITSCEPATFQELFQLIIERICALEEVDPTTSSTNGCPDCVVDIATCFYFQNELGDTIRTMQLVDYVHAIGNRICDIIQDIIEINATLEDHEGRIVDLELLQGTFKSALESFEATQTVTPKYVLVPGTPTPINEVVAAVEQEFGELRTATGTPDEIYQNMSKMEVGINNLSRLAGEGNMSAIEGWTTLTHNLAEQYGNVLLMLADMRASVLNLQATLPTVCEQVKVYLTAEMVGPNLLRLFFTGNLLAGWKECDLAGTQVYVEDSTGGKLTDRVSIASILNNAIGYDIDLSGTPINGLDDITITTNPCFADPDSGTQCQSYVEYYINNTLACPSIILTPTDITIGYQFNHITSDPATYVIELYDSSGTSLLDSNTHPVSGPSTINGEFTGLTPAGDYKVRATVTVGATTTECPFLVTSTLPSPCTPPIGVSATIII